MANIKYVCTNDSCGAFVIAKEEAERPYRCNWCHSSLRSAPKKPFILKKLKSLCSGKSYRQIKDDLPNMAHLGMGVDRTTFALSDTEVLKVARSPHKAKANRIEVKKYLNAPTNIRPYLAPIIDWADDYEWIVMRRATNFGWAHSMDFPAAVQRYVGGDMHGGNVAYINNQPVCTDYVGGGCDWVRE